jgi:hypothetical protein
MNLITKTAEAKDEKKFPFEKILVQILAWSHLSKRVHESLKNMTNYKENSYSPRNQDAVQVLTSYFYCVRDSVFHSRKYWNQIFKGDSRSPELQTNVQSEVVFYRLLEGAAASCAVAFSKIGLFVKLDHVGCQAKKYMKFSPGNFSGVIPDSTWNEMKDFHKPIENMISLYTLLFTYDMSFSKKTYKPDKPERPNAYGLAEYVGLISFSGYTTIMSEYSLPTPFGTMQLYHLKAIKDCFRIGLEKKYKSRFGPAKHLDSIPDLMTVLPEYSTEDFTETVEEVLAEKKSRRKTKDQGNEMYFPFIPPPDFFFPLPDLPWSMEPVISQHDITTANLTTADIANTAVTAADTTTTAAITAGSANTATATTTRPTPQKSMIISAEDYQRMRLLRKTLGSSSEVKKAFETIVFNLKKKEAEFTAGLDKHQKKLKFKVCEVLRLANQLSKLMKQKKVEKIIEEEEEEDEGKEDEEEDEEEEEENKDENEEDEELEEEDEEVETGASNNDLNTTAPLDTNPLGQVLGITGASEQDVAPMMEQIRHSARNNRESTALAAAAMLIYQENNAPDHRGLYMTGTHGAGADNLPLGNYHEKPPLPYNQYIDYEAEESNGENDNDANYDMSEDPEPEVVDPATTVIIENDGILANSGVGQDSINLETIGSWSPVHSDDSVGSCLAEVIRQDPAIAFCLRITNESNDDFPDFSDEFIKPN